MTSVSTPANRARRPAMRLSLTHDQLKRLSLDNYPVVDGNGKVTLSTAPDRPNVKDGVARSYRFLDGSPDAPRGFGIYVGAKKSSYEFQRRVGDKSPIRTVVGDVDEMSPAQAYAKAREKIALAQETGAHPRKAEKAKADLQALERITLRECFERYIAHLEEMRGEKKVKQVSIDSVRASLARLERPEVGLAGVEVRDISEAMAKKAMKDVRRSAQARSNAIPALYREKLEGFKDWSVLTQLQLAEMEIPERYIQRILASGIAAAEHTMGDAIRAVDHVIKQEERDAQYRRRPTMVYGNPLRVLVDQKKFRDAKALKDHYRKAKTRNPLGEKDGTLANVLKVLIARRDEQGGHNATAADYLLLTLLFGARRSETARLKWYDKCSPAELKARAVSWVWLGRPDEMNPTTKKAGSQAFFHDTKSGEERHIPIGHFAEQVLRKRMGEREDLEARWPSRVREAQKRFDQLKETCNDKRKLGEALIALERVKKGEPLKWVFPARNQRAKAGHYSDSKSLLRNVRRDAGLLDLDKEIDIGLTPHDLRRTLGRFAAFLFSGRIVSQLLHHRVRQADDGAEVSERYTEQEWQVLQEAMSKVEEHMIATSPRVWNRLKGAGKPRLDEAEDPPVEIFAWKQPALTDEA